MRTAAMLIFASLLAPILPASAQERKEAPEPAFYKAEFTIRDGSQAAAKGRRYTMFVGTNEKGFFRVGDKVPYATNSFQPGVGTATTQYTYLDTGVNIECRLHESDGKVSVNADFDISAVALNERAASPTTPNPTVSSMRLGIHALLNPGKPTQVAFIDDPVSMRKFEIEATITKVN